MAYVTNGANTDVQLLDMVSARCIVTLPAFKPQNIANALWGFAKLGHNPGNEFLDLAALEALRKLDGFTPQNLANTLWAYATLDVPPPHNLTTAVCNATMLHVEEHCAHALSTLMWSLSVLRHDPGAAFVSRVMARATSPDVLDTMQPQALALTLLGVGLFGYNQDGAALQRLLAHARSNAASFDAQALANTLWACAMLGMVTRDTWNTLVAHFDPSRSVPTKRAENLRQIHQALLVATMDTEGVLEGFDQPQELLEAAKAAWLADVSSVSVSSLQREVGAALTLLGFDPALEHVVADGAFSVDFALVDARVAVEVDGPHHFAANTRRQLATTKTRHELLRFAGWKVVQVCFYDWQPLRGNTAAQQELLTRLLEQHGVAVGAAAASANVAAVVEDGVC